MNANCPTRIKAPAERRRSTMKDMFREIKNDDDVTDIIARFFAFIAIPRSEDVIAVAIWTILRNPGISCGPGSC